MALILLLLASAMGKLKVIEPVELKTKFTYNEDGGILSSLANFGNPPYGSYIIGRLHVHEDSLITGCQPLPRVKGNHGVMSFTQPILLLNRGECSFVIKVRNAQNSGAVGVLIVDDREQDPTHVVMIDDGTAGNLYIPSMLISKSDGETLKDYFNKYKNERIRLQMSFEMPHPDNIVEYEIWMSSEQQKLRDFLGNFSTSAKALTKATDMTPHYVLWYSIERSRENFAYAHSDCLSGGRYCAPDPDFEGPRTGREIVMEDLRQICIYQYSISQKNTNIWWNYVEAFRKCDGTQFNDVCANKTMKSVGINTNDVQMCIEKSFTGKDKTVDDNNLLKKERNEMLAKGIFFYPAVVINNQTFRGDLEPGEVLYAICAGFKDKNEYCNSYFLQNNSSEAEKKVVKGISSGKVAMIILFSLVVVMVILFFYRKWLRRDMSLKMKSEVSSAVSQYIALTDQSVLKGGS